jgi:CheY-like chemotaxis protein
MKQTDLNSTRLNLARYVLGLFAPAPKSKPQPQPKPARPEVVCLGKRGTILLVDDDEVILKTTSAKLESAGYAVVVARDCAEAIGAAGRQTPDVILLDLTFPPDVAAGGMGAWDGLQLMHWMRGLKNTRGASFFVITSSDSPELKKRARAAGVAAFFNKPLDHEKLLEAIRCRLQPPAPVADGEHRSKFCD